MEERKDICEGYERDSVQQLDKLAKDKNERFPIYPLTYIQAVYDARTKERLDSILWKCNNVYLPWTGSAGDTRIQLPFWMRRKGIIITYKNLDEETITEKLTYDLCIADDFFRLDSSWTRITDALPVGGNITIGSNGNWFQDGVDTGFKAQGPKGDNGLTPMLRTVNNKLRYSYDGEVWYEISEYIAAWFRYQDNKIQISRDQKTWSDLSKPFTQDLYIKGYVATSSALPSTGVKQGDIYMVGPTYAAEDSEHKNPIYRMYVYNDSGWVDNGVFQSIAAGVVQTIGNSETEVMSQKAVSSIVGLDTYPVFSDTKPYVKGDIVNYGGLLYEFTADHEAGEWIGTDARETSLRGEVSNVTDKFIVLGSTNFIKDCYDITKDENITITPNGIIKDNNTFDYVGKSVYFENSDSGLLDFRYILSNIPEYVEYGRKIKIIAEISVKGTPKGGNNQIRIITNNENVINHTSKEYNKDGIYKYQAEIIYSQEIKSIGIFIIRYVEPASIEVGRVYIGYDNYGSIIGDNNIYNNIQNLYLKNTEQSLDIENKTNILGSYNFIRDTFNIVDSNCNILNGVVEENTVFNYNGNVCKFHGTDSDVVDCRIILQKLPDDVRVGSMIKVVAEVFAEDIPDKYYVNFSVLKAGSSSRLNEKKIVNGYSVYKSDSIEVTQSMKDAIYSSVVLFFPIQTFAYPCKITIGRVYIGYDTNGSSLGDYNIYKRLNSLDDTTKDITNKLNSLKVNNSHNFLTSPTDVNSDVSVGTYNAELAENTIFNYEGNMFKYSGGEDIKDCRIFMQYIPNWVKVGQKIKILAEVYIDGVYANFRKLVANQVVEGVTTMYRGYNVLEFKDIEVTESLKNAKVGALGIFTPLQAGDVTVYIGRMYMGLDGEGSLIGDTNLDKRLKELENFNIKEKINYLSNANSPNVMVSPNGDRFILSISDSGQISASKISCKKILYLGNSFVSHIPDESKGWTPTEAWGMAAETKEKDFVHRIDTMIKSIIPNAEIAGIINIVPWEGNTHGFEKSKLDYIQDIDFDCVVFRVGENVKEWDDFDTQAIDLLDNHILSGKNNIPVFVSSMFSVEAPTNSISSKNEVLKNIANHYHTPFSYIGVNTGTQNNIYSAILSPIPPKSDGTEWNKSDVMSSVLNGHPGNIGHDFIASRFFNSIKLYYKY